MKLTDFDYSLPKDLIAQFPSKERSDSRLLVLNRQEQSIEHKRFCDILDYLNKGDLLVLNDTKVILARLFGRRKNTGGKVEALLLDKISDRHFRALIKPLARLKIGEDISINNNGLSFKLIDAKKRIIEFNKDKVLEKLGEVGHVPLPQYIKREDADIDRLRYQTVYARREGAIAAPTAGLHFTKPLLEKIRSKGVNIGYITLHVGYGTFAPVLEEDVENHKMHAEYFEIPLETARLVNEIKGKGKIIAVGTTTTRALEANKDKIAKAEGLISGHTDLFICPPFKFQLVDALVTNFHLPKSTLYMLVAAFAGIAAIKKAYRQAIEDNYRFYSYGDAMLIL
jgi:S-adenosylmethionine:tRNA ribosyltransferase-isomerase